MLKKRAQLVLPTAENKAGNGVQNGVQNDRNGLCLIEPDTLGLPIKSMVFTPKKGVKTTDSDLRLQIPALISNALR